MKRIVLALLYCVCLDGSHQIPYRSHKEKITITISPDSPTPPMTKPTIVRSPEMDNISQHIPHVRIDNRCCNTKLKLALIAAGATVATATISALIAMYSKSCN